jgi:hypothetical protein
MPLEVGEGETANLHLTASLRTQGIERVRRANLLLAYRPMPSPRPLRTLVRNHPVCGFMREQRWVNMGESFFYS